MGISLGDTDQTKTSNSNSQTNPWGPAIPDLTTLLAQLGQTPTSVTPAQTQAFGQLEANAQGGNPFAGGITTDANSMLSAGNAGGAVTQANNTVNANLGATAAGANLDPTKNPAIQGMLNTVNQAATKQVNDEFAAAGRDGSAANSKALGAGLANAEAPILTNQYNQNVQDQLAANNQILSGGAAATAGQTGANTSQAAIQGGGINATTAALAAENYTPDQILALEQQQTSLPFQNLGLLASLLYPAAGLGNTQTASGTSDTNTEGFGLSANILSDERFKTDKKQLGHMDDGTPIFSFKYKGDPITHVGPMAQDVEKRTPGAVTTNPQGVKFVNLDLATRKAAQAFKAKRVAQVGV